jgi:hypothetical protein
MLAPARTNYAFAQRLSAPAGFVMVFQHRQPETFCAAAPNI